MASAVEIWPINTDCKVLLSGVKDDNEAFINDATITAVMKDANGLVVANADGIAFAYIAGSNGDYEGIIPNTADMLPARNYTLYITAEKAGRVANARMTRAAAYIAM